MRKVKFRIILVLVVVMILSVFSTSTPTAASMDYTVYNVVSGDSLWKISIKFNTTIQNIKSFNSLNTDVLYIGQKVNIPVTDISKLQRPVDLVHTVISGETLWKISNAYKVSLSSIFEKNNLTQNSIIMIGQKVIIPLGVVEQPVIQPTEEPVQQVVNTIPYITYQDYYVKSGDTVWGIATKFGITVPEVLKANGLTENSSLSINQKLSIPVHNVPITQTKGDQYGEYLDWWTQAQYVFTINEVAKVTDFYTGKSWYIKRILGANHADVETLTEQDTQIMKSVWNGTWSWASRPVIIEVDGRRLAASLAGMPHAGVDWAPGGQIVDNRSGNYGTGTNFDYIKGNGMDGQVDLHFVNSVTHNTGMIIQSMQDNIKIAAGM